MSLFFCGIGGIGMSALARWCQSEGFEVLGSDQSESSLTDDLQEEGVTFFFPQRASNISKNIEAFVYSEAISLQHPERLRAKELEIPEYSYFEYLGKMTEGKKLIAVCGTHGKTTTTGLIASGCILSGMNPTVVIGAQMPSLKNSNFRAGSNLCIVEACEYRENFRFLSPEIVVLTNLELDHMDYYKSEEDYLEAFRRFIKNSKKVICHKEDLQAEKLLQGFKGEVFFADPEKLSLQLMGDHNQANAQLALAVGDVLKAPKETFRKGVENFTGTARRQEFIGEKKGVRVYDDYGHHPTEIEATYQAFLQAFPGKKVGLIFQPHQYSRSVALLSEFRETLLKISPLGILPIYESRDSNEDKAKISSELFSKECGGEFLMSLNDIDSFFKKQLEEDDILLFMGAGNVSQTAHDWINRE